MTQTLDAKAHAESWIDAWNAHDLDRILSHYSEDVVFEAQTVVLRWNQPEGRLLGKDALKKHFALGLEIAPHLHFTLEDIFLTPSGYAILYHRENGNRVIDAVTVNAQGLSSHVIAYYKSAQK